MLSSRIDENGLLEYLSRHQKVNFFLQSISHKQIMMALFSLHFTSQYSFVPASRIGQRILYFDHPNNQLIREYRFSREVTVDMYIDFEQSWPELHVFYEKNFPLVPSTIFINLYHEVAQQRGHLSFAEYLDYIEKIITAHLLLLLAKQHVYDNFFEKNENTSGLEYCIKKSCLKDCAKIAFQGYCNETTFGYKNKIESLPSENILILDSYAFDVNELEKSGKSHFYINPHTHQGYSVWAAGLLRHHPRLGPKVKATDQAIMELRGALSGRTVKTLINFVSHLKNTEIGSEEEKACISQFDQYYRSMAAREKEILDKKAIFGNNHQLDIQKYNFELFYQNAFVDYLTPPISAREILNLFVSNLRPASSLVNAVPTFFWQFRGLEHRSSIDNQIVNKP